MVNNSLFIQILIESSQLLLKVDYTGFVAIIVVMVVVIPVFRVKKKWWCDFSRPLTAIDKRGFEFKSYPVPSPHHVTLIHWWLGLKTPFIVAPN